MSTEEKGVFQTSFEDFVYKLSKNLNNELLSVSKSKLRHKYLKSKHLNFRHCYLYNIYIDR